MRLRASHASARTAAPARGGYVIFAVLIVIVVLSLVAYRFADAMVAEQHAAVRTSEEAQARLAAVSGLHYAAAVLSDRDTFYGELDGNPFDNPDIFEEFEVQAAPGGTNPPRRAYFSIRAVAPADGGGYAQRFGVVDEGGKLNVNSLIALDPTGQVLHDALMKIPDMTEEIADAIVDWVDADDDARAGGAESAYYLALSNPYKAKNGPLNTLDELLLVKGVTDALLYGGDKNRNGVQDEGEPDNTRGWSDYVTVYGRELNVDMTGTARIYLNGDDLDTTYKQLEQAVGAELATYVVASKLLNPQPNTQALTGTATFSPDGKSMTVNLSGSQPAQNQRPTVTATTDQLYAVVQARIASTGSSGKRIRSLVDLMDTKITLPRDPMAKPEDPDVVAYSPLSDPAKRSELLGLLMDKTTVRQAIEMVPRVNVNTAPREVLMSIVGKDGNPILTDAEADAIITNRVKQVTDPAADPGTVSGAWLVATDTISAAKYKQMEKYITGSTMVYRVQSIGYLAGGGPVARMEAVIDIGARDAATGAFAPRFLFVRDLSEIENPRGFQPGPPK